MGELFASGGIADLVLALMLAELAGLLWWLRRQGRSLPAGLLTTLASGACMMLALRAALLGQAWTSIAPWLTASFVTHGADLVVRLRHGSRRTPSRASSLDSRPA
jgi:uncharacterized membrane protein YhiD involved in acid resistance